jgi:hypothetical protein
MKQAARSKQQAEQASVEFQRSTRRYDPEDRNLHNQLDDMRRCEDLKEGNIIVAQKKR